MTAAQISSSKYQFFDFNQLEKNIVECVGQNFKLVRQAKHHSQAKMAKGLGISLGQYRKYESGIDLPPMDIALRWSVFSGAPIYTLLNNSAYQAILPPFETNLLLQPFYLLTARLEHAGFAAMWQLINQFTNQQQPLPSDCQDSLGFIDNHTLYQAIYEQLGTALYQHVAQNIIQFRQTLGLSQASIAELIGVSERTYRGYELNNERTRFSMLIAVRFYVVFGQNPVTMTQGTLFSNYRQRQINRLQALHGLIDGLNPSQYQAVQRIAEQLAHLSLTK